MNGEAQEEHEESSRGLVWVWLCWLGAVLMFYVLSSGPVVMLQSKKVIRENSPYFDFFGKVYSPLNWVYLNTALHKPLGIYWHLWAPRFVDNKGNPRIYE